VAADEEWLVQRLVGLPAKALRFARKAAKNSAIWKRLEPWLWKRLRPWHFAYLGRRAAFRRKRSRETFIAVTGSSGKTTTAALISHILSGVAPVRQQLILNTRSFHVRSLLDAPSGTAISSPRPARPPQAASSPHLISFAHLWALSKDCRFSGFLEGKRDTR
jgi:hypothetical protein